MLIDADPETVFSVLSDLEGWSVWNPDVKWVKVEGSVEPGTVFRWKAGPNTITSTLRAIEAPGHIGWTGSMMGIRAAHVFWFEPKDGGTLARSAESFDGLLVKLLKGYSRRRLEQALRDVLAQLKVEAELRAARG